MDTPKYPPIIVTGPQRSGTTIATHIFADKLSLTPVEEHHFIPGNDYTNCIIQSPNALDGYIMLQHMYPGVQFLFVRRDPEQIIASMKRIQWCKDDVSNWEAFIERYVISRIRLWEHIKKHIPDACKEIQYESLQTHPMFVPTEDRLEFTSKQWHPDYPVGPRYWSNNIDCIKELYATTFQ
jgi:hypothetical protein